MVRVRNNPHLRGVNYNVTKEEFMTDGSSPLAWGQLKPGASCEVSLLLHPG